MIDQISHESAGVLMLNTLAVTLFLALPAWTVITASAL
jgi:hypothetical protein